MTYDDVWDFKMTENCVQNYLKIPCMDSYSALFY